MKNLQSNNKKNAYAKVDDDVFEIIQEMGLKFCIDKYGYFISTTKCIQLPCMMKKKQLQLHVFVWILKTGEEPSSEVDHIDRNPLNNQFSNLRLASRREQQHNRGKCKSNTSGYIGVSHQHINKKYKDKTYENDYWYTQIRKPDGHTKAKRFPFTEAGKIAAGKWYDSKAREYFGEFHGELNFPTD